MPIRQWIHSVRDWNRRRKQKKEMRRAYAKRGRFLEKIPSTVAGIHLRLTTDFDHYRNFLHSSFATEIADPQYHGLDNQIRGFSFKQDAHGKYHAMIYVNPTTRRIWRHELFHMMQAKYHHEARFPLNHDSKLAELEEQLFVEPKQGVVSYFPLGTKRNDTPALTLSAEELTDFRNMSKVSQIRNYFSSTQSFYRALDRLFGDQAMRESLAYLNTVQFDRDYHARFPRMLVEYRRTIQHLLSSADRSPVK